MQAMWTVEESTSQESNGGLRMSADENYNRMRKRIFESVKIRCKECKGVMIQVYDLWDQTVVGYSCKDCTHYYLFDNNPV